MIIVMDIVSTKKTNTIAISTASINCYSRKVRDCYKLEDFNIDKILIDEKSHENIVIYKFSYKSLIDPKPLCIRFDKIDGFIRIYDRT